ncbi:MAG: hypothetical protein RIQ88_805 [Actinomycetota bacterium]|jgi:Family of unknown function (DUF6459)
MKSPATKTRKLTTQIASDDYFSAEILSTAELADPEPLLAFLARAVIETMAGIRSVEQCARWLTDGVYQQLKQKSLEASRKRAAAQSKILRPNLVIGKISTFSPREGVIEAVVIVYNQDRARAVAIRLEAYNNRWRAKTIAVL